MNCLTCQNVLLNVVEKEIFGQISYEICEKCGGLWLDKGELDKIALQTPGSIEESSLDYLDGKEPSKAKASPKSPPRKCLKCKNQQMIILPFMDEPNIPLDYCELCGGIWLDGGELAQVNECIKSFDEKAKQSKFDHFLKHLHSTFWHRIEIHKTDQPEGKKGPMII